MKLLLAVAGLLTLVGLVWLAISVDDATERGRPHETPVVTPVGVLTPADAAADAERLAAPPQPEPAAAAGHDEEHAEGHAAAPAPASDTREEGSAAAPAWTPPDPERFARKYADLDAPTAALRASQVRHQVETRAASVLADIYYREGRYTVWPYTYDARGNRQPATSAIPPAELVPIHHVYDAPDERAWHLVVLTPAERPDLYDLRQEAQWLGSRGRSGDGDDG